MRRRLCITVFMVMSGVLVGCGDDRNVDTAETESAAFAWTNGNEIRVSRATIGQDWLLQASAVQQEMANLPTGLQSRIVRFVVQGDELLMLDVGERQSIGEYHSALAKFPIVSASNRSVTIDFDAGMRSTFIYSTDWIDTGLAKVPASLAESYVVDGRQDGTRFVIRQAAQVDLGLFVEERHPFVFVYYLKPYVANARYSPMVSPGHDTVSFFENTAHYRDNLDPERYVARFDSARPIRYAISADVPAEFRDVVREGVLYWNAVMGRNFVEVIDAPAGRHAPDADLNIIEWIRWDDAGFAYADAQLDPRTGEVLHAQVLLTSGWAVYSREEAFRLAVADEVAMESVLTGSLLEAKRVRRAKVAMGRNISVLGLRPSPTESHEDSKVFATAVRGLNRLAHQGASNAQILEASRDVVRLVTAHEVGHTLGLRHNFAGSAGANYSAGAEASLVSDYLANGGRISSGVIPSSSVMDYGSIGSDFLLGDVIGQRVALTYDVAAMRVLYDGAAVDSDNTPVSCNDEALALSYGVNFTDCNAFDTGGSMLANAVQARDDVLDRAVTGVLERAVAYVTDARQPRGVEEVTFRPSLYGGLAPVGGFATHLGFAEVLSYFYPQEDAYGLGVLVSNLRQAWDAPTFPDLGELEAQALVDERTAALLAELAAGPALADVMAPLNQDWVDARQIALDAILANPALTSGQAPDGTPYALSATDIDTLRQKGHALLQAIPQHYFASLTDIASGFYTSPIDGPMLEILGSVRARVARDGVFATSRQTLTGTVTLTSMTSSTATVTPTITRVVSLPVPLFQQADRLRALDLLGGVAPRSDWNTAAAMALATEIEDYGMAQFGVTWQELVDQQAEIPYPMRRWVEDLISLHDTALAYSGF